MRISNDNIINSTNERLIQVKNNALLKNVNNGNTAAENRAVNPIAASVRENNASMQVMQSNLTRNQIALEALDGLLNDLNGFQNTEIQSLQAEQIQRVIKQATDNARFSGERVLNLGNNSINNSTDFQSFMQRLSNERETVETHLHNNRTEINRLLLRSENQLAAMSFNSVANIQNGINDILNNMNNGLSVQSNVQSEQVRELLNR